MVNWNGSISRWALFPKDWLIHVFADSGVGGVVLAIRRFRAMPSATRLFIRFASSASHDWFVTRLWLYISDVIHTKKRLNHDIVTRVKCWLLNRSVYFNTTLLKSQFLLENSIKKPLIFKIISYLCSEYRYLLLLEYIGCRRGCGIKAAPAECFV